jgi:hypothetical protein
VNDFTEPIATMIFIAIKGHNSDGTVLKFSLTSPTRTHAHQLLNTRQSKAFEDLKQSMFHIVLLAGARRVAVGTHTRTYVCQWAHYMLAQGASHGECSVGNLFYANQKELISNVTMVLHNFLCCDMNSKNIYILYINYGRGHSYLMT